MPSPELTARIYAATADIAPDIWNSLVPGGGTPDNPFLDHAFFLALEQSGSATNRTGWQPQHVLISDAGGQAVGLMPLYLKSHSQGEYVFDHGWAQAYQQAGGSYYPKLQAAIPFTPVTAPKLLVPSGEPAIRRALLSTTETLAERLDASSVHATFVPEEEELLAADAGWMYRHDTQFHWHNAGYASFEDFLDSMSSRHRKNVRRERREALAEGLVVKWLTGGELTESVWDAFFAFYMDTGNRKWGRPYLNRRFFSLLSAAMADRIVLMFAYDRNEPVAGTLSLLGRDTLYGRYWGATRELPFLHFELCYYQAIDFAISRGLSTVEAGAQGEHKLARGYVPTITRSVHWVRHSALRQAIARFVEQERRSVAREQDAMEQFTPFRKGDAPERN